jgi:glyoxylate reductase
MAGPKAYMTRPLHEEGLVKLREKCEVENNPEDEPLPREVLLEKISDKDAVMGQFYEKIDAEFFDAAPRLKVYTNYAVGFENIDVAEATGRGIPVCNTPGVLDDATAEHAWTLMMAAARRVREAHDYTAGGKWRGWSPFLFTGRQVCGATLGVIGAGRIGSRFARMAKGFGMRVLYVSRTAKPELDEELGAEKVDLDTLLSESDFVAVHLTLNDETRHMLDEAALDTMKKGAILVNTSRGAVMDEAALTVALEKGRIAAAALDVFEEEPEIHPGLLELDNVVLSPHIGSNTLKTRIAMAAMAAENLMAVLDGREPPACLNPEVL